MSLPSDPICGDYVLSNSAGFDDRWTCPNCYADHIGGLEDTTVQCDCGATLKLTIEQRPVCVATCIDPDEEED
jgi:hypothetical protein